jgi:acyl-coenzyme A synthetase/AMP-(fatty) acid ligase
VIVAATKLAPAPVGHAALLLTTSGSTGVPKLVPIAQPAIDRFASWAGPHFAIDAGTAVLNCAPLNFDLCLLDIWTSLARGATVVLVDQVETTHAGRLLDLLLAQEVAVVQAVPLCLRLLVEAARERGRRIGCVEQLIVTGEALRPAALEALGETFSAAVMHNVYGCTETNDSFCDEIDLADVRRRGASPIGRPLPGVRARLVGDGGAIVAGAGVGELWVSTPFQTSGYLDASLNAGRFVAGVDAGDPLRTYFRTGDLVRRHADGELTVEGRADLQVKVRGVRVDRAAIEGVLAEHPAVAEAAVLTSDDEAAGTLLHAVVGRRPGAALDGLALRAHCAAHLPLAAIPARMTLVDRPLPRTSTGKLDRAALGRELAEDLPTVSTPATTR